MLFSYVHPNYLSSFRYIRIDREKKGEEEQEEKGKETRREI